MKNSRLANDTFASIHSGFSTCANGFLRRHISDEILSCPRQELRKLWCTPTVGCLLKPPRGSGFGLRFEVGLVWADVQALKLTTYGLRKGLCRQVLHIGRAGKCEGISPLGYLQKVNQSPTQTKPYNTLPPFEPRDSWSSYGAVRAYSEVLL